MKNEEMGVIVEVSLADQGNPPPPYYKVAADRYACTDCQTQVFLPARFPVAEHFQENYGNFKTNYQARLRG